MRHELILSSTQLEIMLRFFRFAFVQSAQLVCLEQLLSTASVSNNAQVICFVDWLLLFLPPTLKMNHLAVQRLLVCRLGCLLR